MTSLYADGPRPVSVADTVSRPRCKLLLDEVDCPAARADSSLLVVMGCGAMPVKDVAPVLEQSCIMEKTIACNSVALTVMSGSG